MYKQHISHSFGQFDLRFALHALDHKAAKLIRQVIRDGKLTHSQALIDAKAYLQGRTTNNWLIEQELGKARTYWA